MNQMTFEEFLEQPDLKKVKSILVKKFSKRKFSNLIDGVQDILQCFRLGAYKAYTQYDPNHKSISLSKYCYFMGYYEVLNLIKENNPSSQIVGYRDKQSILFYRIYSTEGSDSISHFADTNKFGDRFIELAASDESRMTNILLDLKGLERDIFIKKFIENKTLHEIGDELGYSHEWIRRLIEKIVRKCRKLV